MDWRTKVELLEQIRREYEFGVGTIAGVAKKLKVHRRMVREAIGSALPMPRKKVERPRWKLAGGGGVRGQILETDKKAPRKQRHTAHRIWERMRAEMPECSDLRTDGSAVRPGAQDRPGPGGSRSVRSAELRLGRGGAGGLVRSLRRSGWGADEAAGASPCAAWPAARRSTARFCMPRSRRSWRRTSWRSPISAGCFAGSVTTISSSAVKKILRGQRREETARFIAFRSHWRFESEFCTPGEGHEKGGVEGEVGYFRRNHWVPVPQAVDIAELEPAAARRAAAKMSSGRSPGGSRASARHWWWSGSICCRWRRREWIWRKRAFPTVNSLGCVKVLTNAYSAPLKAGTEVHAKVYASTVELWHDGRCVARHERCYRRQQQVLDLEHYLDVLSAQARRTGRIAAAGTATPGRTLAGRVSMQIWQSLMERHGKQSGTKQMIELLKLARQNGHDRLREAIETALATGCTRSGRGAASAACRRVEPRGLRSDRYRIAGTVRTTPAGDERV